MKQVLILALLAAMGGISHARSSRNVYPCPLFGETRLPHAWSCSRFIQCINVDAVEEHCAEGLHYNAETQQCMDPSRANCTVEDHPCPRWSDPEDMVYLSNPRSCDRFYLCFNGEAKPHQCADGLTFNLTTNQCQSSQCSPNFWSCHSTGNYVAPDDSDCSRFFHCVDGVQYGVSCRAGLLFDSVSERCVEPRDAVCGQFTTVPASTPTVPNTSWVHTTPTTAIPSTTGHTHRPSTTTTQRATTSTTQRPATTTTQRATTTHRPTTQRESTTQRATTTHRPTTQHESTTQRATTTHRPTTQRESTTQRATTTHRPTTQRESTTQRATTTHRPTTQWESTTQRESTTQKATTQWESTTQRESTTHRPTTQWESTTQRESTTHKPTTQQASTTQKASTTEAPVVTTVLPEINLNAYCKIHDVGAIALVPHPQRCDWYIQCVLGEGHVGHCARYQIFSAAKKRCVLGNPDTCKVADEADEIASEEAVLAIEAIEEVDPIEVAAVEVLPDEEQLKPLN